MEELFVGAVLAEERVEDLVEGAVGNNTVGTGMGMRCAKELVELVGSGDVAVAEAARRLGVVGTVRRAAETVQSAKAKAAYSDAAETLETALGRLGDGAASVEVVMVCGEAVSVVIGELVDGVCARLWPSARILCERLPPDAFAGSDVLELGSGAGLVGLLLARRGAKSVTLTDAVPAALRNIARAAALPANGGGSAPVRVAALVWDDEDATTAAADAAGVAALPAGERFGAVVGSDLLYEAGQAAQLAAEVAARLAPGGLALIALAVRDDAHRKELDAALPANGLAATALEAVPAPEYDQGDYVVLTLRHADDVTSD